MTIKGFVYLITVAILFLRRMTYNFFHVYCLSFSLTLFISIFFSFSLYHIHLPTHELTVSLLHLPPLSLSPTGIIPPPLPQNISLSTIYHESDLNGTNVQQHTQHNVHGIKEDKLNVHLNGLEGSNEVDDEEEEEEYDGYLEVRQMEVRFSLFPVFYFYLIVLSLIVVYAVDKVSAVNFLGHSYLSFFIILTYYLFLFLLFQSAFEDILTTNRALIEGIRGKIIILLN